MWRHTCGTCRRWKFSSIRLQCLPMTHLLCFTLSVIRIFAYWIALLAPICTTSMARHLCVIMFLRDTPLTALLSCLKIRGFFIKYQLNFCIVAGEGGIGVSNALGANTLAILFALGLPWLIKTLTLLVQGYDTAVTINSAGIDFIVGSLIVAACCLWITLCIGRFKLRRSIGVVLFLLYAIFITFAILVEMGIILDREVLLWSEVQWKNSHKRLVKIFVRVL